MDASDDMQKPTQGDNSGATIDDVLRDHVSDEEKASWIAAWLLRQEDMLKRLIAQHEKEYINPNPWQSETSPSETRRVIVDHMTRTVKFLQDDFKHQLASRDAEIERLKARQIPPEMERIYQEYVALEKERAAADMIVYPSEMYYFMRDVWDMFIKLMEGKEKR